MALKDLEARYATKRPKNYKLTDGEGLYLLVRPNGSKLWRFKYRFAGKGEAAVVRAVPGRWAGRRPAAPCGSQGRVGAGAGP